MATIWIMATIAHHLLLKIENIVQDNFSLFLLTVNCLETQQPKLTGSRQWGAEEGYKEKEHTNDF